MGWSTRQAVSKAAQSQRIFSWTHKAERYFPTFYADPAYDRKHLEVVSKALAAGRVAKVKDIAAAFAQEP